MPTYLDTISELEKFLKFFRTCLLEAISTMNTQIISELEKFLQFFRIYPLEAISTMNTHIICTCKKFSKFLQVFTIYRLGANKFYDCAFTHPTCTM